jgi:hypothetical protein
MRQDDHLIFEALQVKQQTREQENPPHGYPQGITAIQNTLMNELKKRGFQLTKIHHADKERDAYPTVFMMRNAGAMHHVVEIDGMGVINGEPYAEYLKVQSEDEAEPMMKNDGPGRIQDGSEDAESYDAMMHLTKAANQIRDILLDNADDEARTEHIIRMAQIILGSKADHADAEYRKMLDGLIVILNRFIIVPMN